jgi:hypothetical protein
VAIWGREVALQADFNKLSLIQVLIHAEIGIGSQFQRVCTICAKFSFNHFIPIAALLTAESLAMQGLATVRDVLNNNLIVSPGMTIYGAFHITAVSLSIRPANILKLVSISIALAVITVAVSDSVLYCPLVLKCIAVGVTFSMVSTTIADGELFRRLLERKTVAINWSAVCTPGGCRILCGFKA